MKNVSTHILKIGGDLSELKGAFSEAGKLFDNLYKNGIPPKELTAAYGKIIKTLDTLEAKTKNGVFKGTEAEYASILKLFDSIGTEFETFSRIMEKIGSMDDDSLSKFLTKEDFQVYKKTNAALKEYYELVKKIGSEKSEAYIKAESKLTKAKDRKTEAVSKQEKRSQELKSARSAVEPVLAAREKTKTAKQNLAQSQSDLTIAKSTEKSKKTSVEALQGELDALDAQIEKEKALLSNELQELKNAKANFTKIKKFYETTDENGQARDKNQDYGTKSYRQAEARVQAAESKLGSLRELERQRTDKKTAYAGAAEDYSKIKSEISGYTAAVEKNTKAVEEAENAQKQLEEQNEEALKTYKQANQAVRAAANDVSEATRAVTDAQAAFDAVAAAEKRGENRAKELQEAYTGLREEAKKLGINLEDIEAGEEYTEESAKRLTSALEKQKNTLVNGVRVQDNYVQVLEDTDEALEKNRQETERTATAQSKLNQETSQRKAFEDKIKQFLGVAGAMEVFRKAARDAIQTISELDATMTEMAVVTDLSVGDYWSQLPEYSKQASELGVSINSAYKAATLYYQQGLKGEEVTKISAQTLKMARIAGLDAAEATDKMTAALRGFNMELNEASAQKISDVYSELAAITAADVDEISSAMTKTASIASSAGMEFETTAAFLSQIIETTRESAETAGTAMKTVIARFQELKKAPGEIGEVDGEIVDANAIETALRSVGVSLRDAKGQFRELDDVFLELSSKWSSLDKNTQRYIATIAAGSRQQSRFIAMMSDYGRTQELVTAANNSAGASQEQFEKTTESLEFKVEKLKNSWHEFTMGIMNSDFVKFGVDVLNTFMEIVNKATGALDGFGGSFMKIASVLAIFQMGKKIFQKIVPTIDGIMLNIVKKFHGYGKEAMENFEKGAQGVEENKKEKSSAQNTAKEERAEKAKQKKLTAIRNKISGKEEEKVTFREKMGATWSKVKDPLGTKKLKSQKDQLTEEIEGLQKTREGLQTRSVQEGLGFSSQDRTTLSNVDSALAQKKKELEALEGQIQEKSLGGRFKSGFKSGFDAATGNHFKNASEARDRAVELQQQLDRRTALGDSSEARDKRLRELEQQRAAALKAEDAARNTKFKARGTANEGAAEKELLKQKKALIEIEKEQNKLQAEEAEYQKLLKDGEAIEEEFNAETEKYVEERSAGWQSLGDSISKAGQAVAGVGMAMTAVGGILSQLGLEDAGEVITKIGTAVTFVGSAMSAIPPILTAITAHPIILVITAIVAAIVALGVAIHHFATAEERELEKARKATENAKKAAEEAKEAYDTLLSGKSSYDDLQKSLNDLTTGTLEWKQALIEANSQVLDLLKTYPQLAKYIQRGENGQLTISDEGWDVLIEKQERGVKNSQALLMSYQIGELQNRASRQAWDTQHESWEGTYTIERDYSKTFSEEVAQEMAANNQLQLSEEKNINSIYEDGLINELLTSLVLYSDQDNETIKRQVEEALTGIAQKNATEDDIYHYANYDSKVQSIKLDDTQFNEVIEKIRNGQETSERIENEMLGVARANLTTLASDTVSNSKYSSQIIDSFAHATLSDSYQDTIQKKRDEITNTDSSGKESIDRQGIEQLAKDYGVEDKLVNNDTADLEMLYKTLLGVTEIPDDIAGNNEKLIYAITQVEASKTRQNNMDAYAQYLDTLDTKTANNVAGLMSYGGANMSNDFALEMYNAFEGVDDTLSNKKLEAYLESAGTSLKEVAEKLGMSTTDYLEYARKNINMSLKANKQVFQKLNKTLGREGSNAYTKFGGENTVLSNSAEKALSEQIIQVSGNMGVQNATKLKEQLDAALEGAGDQAAIMATYLEGMDWSNVDEWELMAENLTNLGIDVTNDAIEEFIKNGVNLAGAIKRVDLSSFNSQVNNTISLLERVKEGDKKYSEEDYKSIVAANKDLEKDFVQVGNEFIYLGGSIDDLTAAVQENTVGLLNQANKQMAAQVGISKSLQGVDDIAINDNTTNEELIDYLLEAASAVSSKNFDLAWLGEKGLGANTDFINASREDKIRYAQAMMNSKNSLVSLQKQQDEGMRDSNIASLTLNTAQHNALKASDYSSEWFDEYAEALKVQGIQNNVGDLQVANYTSALNTFRKAVEEYEKVKNSNASETEKKAAKDVMDQAKNIFSKSANDYAVAINTEIAKEEKAEERATLLPIAEKISEQLEKQRQEQIDKLSQVNESIKSAQNSLINKMQEQINENRQIRENKEARQNITDLYSQQAYFAADTSGANNTALLDTNKQLVDAEQQYQDTLIDQAIQRLQDQNAEAALQRERQIELLQAQLERDIENGVFQDQAQQIINDSLIQIKNGASESTTLMGQLLAESAKGMGGFQAEEAEQDWREMVQAAITAAKPEQPTTEDDNTTETVSPVSADSVKGTGSASTGEQVVDYAAVQAQQKETTKNNAINSAKSAFSTENSGGWANRKNNTAYQAALSSYMGATGGSEEDLHKLIYSEKDYKTASGSFPNDAAKISGGWDNKALGDWDDDIKVTFSDGTTITGLSLLDNDAIKSRADSGDYSEVVQKNSSLEGALNKVTGSNTPGDQWMALYEGVPYIHRNGYWVKVHANYQDNNTGVQRDKLAEKMGKYLTGYETGGLADFTGPAWLDGTKSRPEYVLNSEQTERFFSLVDVLEGYDKEAKPSKSSGDNYFDIEINVEKLENDYDVEKVADKIRRMIYDDATYRNVNTVNHIR